MPPNISGPRLWKLKSPQRHNQTSSTSRRELVPIEINTQDDVYSVVFLTDGEHFISGGENGMLRKWRVADGKEIGKPINVGSGLVYDIAVSRNGMWIASGEENGQVTLLNATNQIKVRMKTYHRCGVDAVDISPEGTKVGSGSSDCTFCVWAIPRGNRLFGPSKHSKDVVGVKFSPDGRLIATATYNCESVRIYESNNPDTPVLVDFSIRVDSPRNRSFVWSSDSKRLYVLSHDGTVHCLDPLARRTLSKWPTHRNEAQCILLASYDTIVAVADNSSVSLWNTTTHRQIGSDIQYSHPILSMAISPNHDLVAVGGKKITLRSLRDTIPPPSLNIDLSPFLDIFPSPSRDNELQRNHVYDSSGDDLWVDQHVGNTMGGYTASQHGRPVERAHEHINLPDVQIGPGLQSRSHFDPTPIIHEIIKQTISDIPPVLIDATTGRLCNRSLQEAAFKTLPIYNDLRSSMATRDKLDDMRIRREVQKFYQYVMFSHKWQPPYEPTFQMLEKDSIDELPDSPGSRKLLGFCQIVRSHHFRWCWSDTCCVNQADHRVQQESIIAMFRWYRQSALTIVHLLGVWSNSEEVASLWKSIWNTRGWTYQEYVASPVVQFYTEDWKPYRGLAMWNHKDSPIVRLEMEHATKVATQELATLQPGLDRAREKLYLASGRQTTQPEDMAYCLFGIFGVAMMVIYGEGKEVAVQRLLVDILTRSPANVTLLSWTGAAASMGSHSYLPADLTVYDEIAPAHVPKPITMDDMDRMVQRLRSSHHVTSPALELYELLYSLLAPALDAGRLRLSGLVFPLTDLVLQGPSTSNLYVYRATSSILGDNIEVKTRECLSKTQRLLLIHPWITPLIDEDFSGDTSPFDPTTRALRLVVRLMQPFGPLLLMPCGRAQYRRVATDSFIKVRIRINMFQELKDTIRIVYVQ